MDKSKTCSRRVWHVTAKMLQGQTFSIASFPYCPNSQNSARFLGFTERCRATPRKRISARPPATGSTVTNHLTPRRHKELRRIRRVEAENHRIRINNLHQKTYVNLRRLYLRTRRRAQEDAHDFRDVVLVFRLRGQFLPIGIGPEVAPLFRHALHVGMGHHVGQLR